MEPSVGWEFDDFWREYPKKTAISAARTAFINQMFFKNARPEQMIAAAKKYRELNSDKDITFIPNPARWLTDQIYLDDDLKAAPASTLEGWKKDLAYHLGEKVVQAWLEDASFHDGVLTLHNGRGWMFKRQYEAKLMMAGVREVV